MLFVLFELLVYDGLQAVEVLAIEVTFQDPISLLTRLVFKESLRAVNRDADRKEHVRLDVLQTERTPLLFLL